MRKRILIINTGGTLSAVMKKNGLIPGLSICDMQKKLQINESAVSVRGYQNGCV